jgi:hypothetical protein
VRLLLLWVALLPAASATTAGDIARAIRENSFDRDECYRVRDLTLVKEDIRLFLTDGYLIFSKPVAGRPVAAVFSADAEGGDGEILLMLPDRAERRSLAIFTDSPNLNEHLRAAMLLFTGDVYGQLKAQMARNEANRKAPEVAQALDEFWGPVLRNLGASYQTRLTFDLLGGPLRHGGLFAALISGTHLGNFDLVYDPDNTEQIFAGQLVARENRVFFDSWTSFAARSSRQNPAPRTLGLETRDYRIDATIHPDLSMEAVARVTVRPNLDNMPVTAFDMSSALVTTEVKVDGRAAEVLTSESLRFNLTRSGNNMFLVVPPEPLRAGRDYEFEFHYSGKVIHDAGEHVFYVSARGSWYPAVGIQFANFDLRFRYPREYDLVSGGDVVEDRSEGEWRITRRRTSAPIRLAAFNLGEYEHARVERGGYAVDVCANRRLERALQPRVGPIVPELPQLSGGGRRRPELPPGPAVEHAPDPLERLQTLASEVASAMEFMGSKFGPPALPHLTVSPIPGTFGQGFPGLIYLSTLSYLNTLPGQRGASQSSEIFFQDMLQAHEVAHQWWGNRVTNATYRDNWLMEALANYSALLYLEKRRGAHSAEIMLTSYRDQLLARNELGEEVDAAGPIVLGTRLESSQEPRAWRTITYGKGSWILQMLRRRMGDERFLAMLTLLSKRYDHLELSTEAFRAEAAQFLPPKTDDPKLERFFEYWVYGTGIPNIKLSYTVRGAAPNLRLAGTITQTGVSDDFSTLVPVEIQTRGKTIVQWVRTADEPVTFTVPLAAQPVKVTLDPHQAVLRR